MGTALGWLGAYKEPNNPLLPFVTLRHERKQNMLCSQSPHKKNKGMTIEIEFRYYDWDIIWILSSCFARSHICMYISNTYEFEKSNK